MAHHDGLIAAFAKVERDRSPSTDQEPSGELVRPYLPAATGAGGGKQDACLSNVRPDGTGI